MNKLALLNRFDSLKNLTNVRFLRENDLLDTFVNEIKFIYVYGVTENRAFIGTNDDKVYFLFNQKERNKTNELLNQKWKVETLEELSNNRVMKIVTNATANNSFDLVLFLTDINLLYGMEYNNIRSTRKPILLINAIGEKVIDICCGTTMFMALTLSGKVYYWHLDYHVVIDKMHKQRLELSGDCFENEKIVEIGCNITHCIALSANGNVYCWRQIWAPNVVPEVWKLDIHDDMPIISSIKSGPFHNLFLAYNGDVYVRGVRLDIEEKEYPVMGKLEVANVSKFKEIAATNERDISIALSANDGFCYVFGEVGNRIVKEAEKTDCRTIEDAFAHYLHITNELTFLNITYV